MLLQTVQNDLFPLAHVRPAKARDIPRAGIVPLLGLSTRGCQNQQDDEEKSGHLSGPSRLAIYRSSVSRAPKPAGQCIFERQTSLERPDSATCDELVAEPIRHLQTRIVPTISFPERVGVGGTLTVRSQ
jgi:hypothetical protein